MLVLYEPGNEAAWLASFSFHVDVRPRYCECDGQGHVSNVVYPVYLELGRLQFFKAAHDPEPHDFAYQHVTAELQLRYLAPCYYDEPLRVFGKLAAVGRSSATLDQAIVGEDRTIRAIARMIVVRSRGDGTAPWSAEQKQRLDALVGTSAR